MLVICVLLTGVSEAWWVRTGSFVSALMLYLAIFSAVSMQECKEKNAHATLWYVERLVNALVLLGITLLDF
jgi:formate-dependent nitrite reductase membrane component NrfD